MEDGHSGSPSLGSEAAQDAEARSGAPGSVAEDCGVLRAPRAVWRPQLVILMILANALLTALVGAWASLQFKWLQVRSP